VELGWLRGSVHRQARHVERRLGQLRELHLERTPCGHAGRQRDVERLPTVLDLNHVAFADAFRAHHLDQRRHLLLLAVLRVASAEEDVTPKPEE